MTFEVMYPLATYHFVGNFIYLSSIMITYCVVVLIILRVRCSIFENSNTNRQMSVHCTTCITTIKSFIKSLTIL